MDGIVCIETKLKLITIVINCKNVMEKCMIIVIQSVFIAVTMPLKMAHLINYYYVHAYLTITGTRFAYNEQAHEVVA